MDRTNLYEDDILAWSEQQAAALRRLASHRDLPNDLDLENVVEEIESVGLSQLRAAESLIRLILLHVAKAASDPGGPSAAHWETECIGWQDELLRAFSPSMRSGAAHCGKLRRRFASMGRNSPTISPVHVR